MVPNDLLWPADARALLRSLRTVALDRVGKSEIPVNEVPGRVLAERISAATDAPTDDIATMDGYAIDATESYPYTIEPDRRFPETDHEELTPRHAVPIATGGTLPTGANAVVKQEDTTVEDGELRGPPVTEGNYVYQRGSNFSAGDVMFENGTRLTPKDGILLGDLGRESILVYDRFSVGILATGTEIHQGIRRDLDSAMLAGLVDNWGHESKYYGSVPDNVDTIKSKITELADKHDVVLTTGGTSVGKKDYVVRTLDALGDVAFHRVRLRPGKPIASANLDSNNSIAIAIPGKPVGAHVVTTLVARAFFTGGNEMLPTFRLKFDSSVDLGPTGFEYAIPVTINDDVAVPLGHVGSDLEVYVDTFDPSVLSSATAATRADGLVVTREPIEENQLVDVIPFDVIEW